MPDDIPGGSWDWLQAWQTGQYSQAMLDALAGGYSSGMPSQDVLGAAISEGGGLPPPSQTVTPPAVAPPVYQPGSGQLSPGELSQALGESSSDWFAAGSLGSFFRRPSRPSRYERALRQGGRALTNALVNAVQRVVRGPGAPIISRSKALVPYVPGPVRFLFGGAVGAVLGLVNPTDLGSGELTAAQRTGKALDVWFPQMLVTARRNELFGPSPPRGPAELFPQMMPMPRVDVLYTPQDRTIPELVREMAREVVRGLVAQSPLGRYVDVDAGPPSPASRSPVPQITIGGPGSLPTPQTPQATRRPIRWGLGAGAILAGLAVEGLMPQRGATRGSVPSLAPSLAPPATPATPPLTTLNAAPLGFSAFGAGGAQYCTPRPRGPRRKCLQRAPVRYSGGPRKGKAAGTKCIRYAAARSSR